MELASMVSTSVILEIELTATGDLVGLGVDATAQKLVRIMQQCMSEYTHGAGAMAAE